MAARHYDMVRPNAEAIKADLKRFGLDMKTLSRKMGKDDAFISSVCRREEVTRSLIEAIEDALFADRGKYTIELGTPSQTPTEPQRASEGMGIVLKQILGAVNALSEKTDRTDELIKAVKEANAANEVILQEMLQKQKELTTLAARILSNLERRQG